MFTYAKLGNLLESKTDNFTQELIQATYHRKIDEVCSLLKKSKPNVADQDGITPLMIASSRPSVLNLDEADDFIRIAKILLDAGADVNARDKQGRTALMYVADMKLSKNYHRFANKGRGEMTTILLNNKADFTLKDNYGKTAFDYMIEECLKKRETHAGVILLADAMDAQQRLAQLKSEIKTLIKQDEIEREEYRVRTEKETKEKNEKLQQEYNNLVAQCKHQNIVNNKGPKDVNDWPKNMDYMVGAKELHDFYQIINDANLWEPLKNQNSSQKALDMIYSHPNFIKAGHSGGSCSELWGVIKYIHHHGWEQFCKMENERSVEKSPGLR